MSISYGDSETQDGAAMNSYIGTLYQTAAAAGVSIFVSSGDSAAAVTDYGDPVALYGISVSGFATTPYNVAVGGTDFSDVPFHTSSQYWSNTNGTYYNSAKSYVPEIPWNDSCANSILATYWGYSSIYGPQSLCNSRYDWLNTVGGSGGPSACASGAPTLSYVVSGTCAGWPKPSWQAIAGNPSDGVRDIPDVSLFASNGFWNHYYVFCLTDGGICSGLPSGWSGAGGTSFGAPIMAGIQALIDQALGESAGNPNPVYYQIGAGQYSTAAGLNACNSANGSGAGCSFNDVTQGDMDTPCGGSINCDSGAGGLGALSVSDTVFEPAYAAGSGWDFATGIGTVNAYNLLNAFVASATPSAAPPAPVLVSPANGSTGVLLQPQLSWNPTGAATSYDIYFGAASPPPLLTSTTGVTYTAGPLSPSTTYYWATGARNSLGATESAAWSFTTGCVSSIAPAAVTIGPGGGTGSIAVTAAAGCAWSASSNVSWLTITSGASGTGSGTVGYTAAAAAGSQRAAVITIAGQIVPVTQAIYPLISTLAGGLPPATPAAGTSISVPLGYAVAPDGRGNVYFPSPNLNAVFKADAAGEVTRFAGTGAAGYSGDGGAAIGAALNGPTGVAVDAAGDVFIADSGNQRIRKVDASGTIGTVAGSGTCCYGGDGASALNANLNQPSSVAVDAAGNLYIADTMNQRVRKVNAAGIISTIAGSGTQGYAGDGGPAANAQLNNPYGVAVDGSGNLYIADTFNLRVRKVDASGNISTYAGNGTYGFSGDGAAAAGASVYEPYGLAVDASGNLFIADSGNSRVRKVSATGIITTVAGGSAAGFAGDGGPASAAELLLPYGVGADAYGDLYIADSGSSRIRAVNAGGTIQTLAGGGLGDGGPGVFGAFNAPGGVARDSAGNTYIADTNDNRVRKVSAAGTITTVAGTGAPGYSGDGGPAAAAQLSTPIGVALDAGGNLYIADSGNYRVRKVDSSGNITTFAGSGNCCGATGDGGKAASAEVGIPYALAADAAGNVYVSDINNNVVRQVNAAGNISTVAGSGGYGYGGDGGPAASAKLYYPAGLALDAAGNLYIADRYNARVRMVSNGVISTVAGSGAYGFSGDGGTATSARLASPTGVAVDAAGDLYITDYANQRVRMVSGGSIATVAGNGLSGYSGDGGPAPSASFRYPSGIAVDASGALAVTDSGNNAVRLLTPPGGPAVLTVESAHSGGFTAGSQGSYTLTVANAGTAGATSGKVTVTETLPAALSLTSMSGPGWTCAAGACTRGDTLAGGSSYPPIAVTVSVAAAAPAQAVNLVQASGGGAPAGAVDLTAIAQSSLLSVTKTHAGSLSQGQAGAAYTITVSSAAQGATSGLVIVADALPAGLSLVSMAGTGWTCAANTCSRSDALAASASYPPITVTANVAANAASPLVNTAVVSGGGSAAASAADSAVVCAYSLNFGGQTFPTAGGSGSVTVSSAAGCPWTASSGASWLTIRGGASGSGSGAVSYGVAANAGAARSATLTVAGAPFLVEQASAAAAGLAAAGSMAQIASGGQWNTKITLLNTGAAAAEAAVNFFDDNGNALSLPVTIQGAASAAPVQAATLDQVIAPGAQIVIQTAGTASQATVEGWAQLAANGTVGGSAVFAWVTPNGSQEAVVPVETRSPSIGFVLPFDYTGGYATGVAVANLSAQPVNIPVVLTDNTGASLGASAAISLPAYAHTSFMLASSYPAVTGKFGAAQFSIPAGAQISVLGIRAAPDGAITTVPVLAK
ncbi:MAG TPA: BACON domain-containing carbohydrate-binding protein [Bryobacteraceae bacterium]|nr:BACON domain-containing carbohydrate-binding protein [Bryobacteraceae bacterium]